MKKPPSAASFWSLQLVAVLGIMYLMLASTDDVDSPRVARALQSAESQIRAAVTRARELARTTRASHGVVFDALGDRVALIQQGGSLYTDGHGNSHQIHFGRPGYLEEVDILGADFGAKGPVVMYDGQGNATTGGSLTLRIGGEDRILVFEQSLGNFVGG